MYDLILSGGTVIDPVQGLCDKLDVAIAGDKIASISSKILHESAVTVLDVNGKIVVPGLIDIHTHIFHPKRNRNHPDIAGVLSGVTTAVDAGGSGPDNFGEFRDVILPRAQTKIYAFLSVFRDRLTKSAPTEADMDVKGVIRVAKDNPEVVKGVKVIVSPRTVQSLGLAHVDASKTAARQAGLRLMMHIGDIGPSHQTPTSPEIVAQAVSKLDDGDLITHIFTPLTGAALDSTGMLLPSLLEAQSRGVFMDTSFGDFNFGWERADTVLAQGLRPDTIATDAEIQAGDGMRITSERGLLEYTAFFFKMGFSLEEIIGMITATPARYLGIQDKVGSLLVGREADISVLELVEGRWRLTDANGDSRIGKHALIPHLVLKSGNVIEPSQAPHSWGWTPPLEAGVNI